MSIAELSTADAMAWSAALDSLEEGPGAQFGPLDLACALNPRMVRTPALELISAELERAIVTPGHRLMISMSPQEGKTSMIRHAVIRALQRNPDKRNVIASHALDLARTSGRAIRQMIDMFGIDAIDPATRLPLPDRLGIAVAADHAAAADWELRGHSGGLYCVGVSGSLTGRPIDGVLFVDDPVKGLAEANSTVFQSRSQDWWQAVSETRLAPEAGVVIVMCIVGGMRVLRGDGRWIPVEQIRPGDTVVSLADDFITLRTSIVTAARCSGRDDTVTVRTDRLSLTTNARHPYAVLRRGRRYPKANDVEWVQAGDLSPGDIVVTAKSLPDDHQSIDTLPDGSSIDNERAWLLGYLMGDGWVTRSNRKGRGPSHCICASIGSSSAPVKAGLSNRVRAALEAWSPTRVYETPGGYLRVDWNAGGRLLAELGYDKGAKGKRIPDVIWDWSVALRQSFIRGYLMADGCLTRVAGTRTGTETWTAVSVNSKLLDDMYDLALTCGIRPSRVFCGKPRLYQPPNSPAPVWSTFCSVRFAIIPEGYGEGRSFLDNYDHPAPGHLRYERVKSITQGDPANVYDISVAGTANFVAEGFVVHNTRWAELDLVGWLLGSDTADEWRVVNIPALADGVTSDALNRPVGEWMRSARGRTVEHWEKIRKRVGERVFGSLYQGRPAPLEGGIFKRDWFTTWRVSEAPAGCLPPTVVVDPADNEGDGDEAGIIVATSHPVTGKVYLLDDLSGSMTVARWARVALLTCVRRSAPTLAYERSLSQLPKRIREAWQQLHQQAVALRRADYSMAEALIRLTRPDDPREAIESIRSGISEILDDVDAILAFGETGPRLKPIIAKGSKALRMQLVAPMFETGRAVFVGHHPLAEHQLATWLPGQDSPDRADAITHACAELAGTTPRKMERSTERLPTNSTSLRNGGTSRIVRSTRR